MQIPQQLKTPADTAAVGGAIAAFFKMVPWPEIAAFLSAIYLVIRIFFVLKNKGKE